MATQWFLSYHITDENISIPYDKDQWQIVFLEHNAFYVDNFTLKYNDTDLVEDIDYVFVLPYRAATRMIGKPMYGGLLVKRKYYYPLLKASYKPVDPDLDINRNILINQISSEMTFITLKAMDELIEGIQDYPYRHGYPDYVNYDSKVVYINELNELRTHINAPSPINDTKIINKLTELTQQPQVTLNNNYIKLAGDTMTGPLLLNYTPQNPNDAVNKSWIDNIANTEQFNVNLIDSARANLVNKVNDTLNNPLLLSRQPIDNTEIVTKKFIDDAASNIGSGSGYNYPTGTLLRVSENTNIPGYLTCNGAKVSKVDYADLYAAIGDKFDPTQALGDGRSWLFQSDFNSYYIPGDQTNFFSNSYTFSVRNSLFPNVPNTVVYNGKTYYLYYFSLLGFTKNKIYLIFGYSSISDYESISSYPYVLEFDNDGSILSSSDFITATVNGNRLTYFTPFRWNNNFYMNSLYTSNTPIPGYPNFYDDSTNSSSDSNIYKINILSDGSLDFNNLVPVTIDYGSTFNFWVDYYSYGIFLNKFYFYQQSTNNQTYSATMKYINDTHFSQVEGYNLAPGVFSQIVTGYGAFLYYFRMKDKVYGIQRFTSDIYVSTILNNGYLSEPVYTGKTFSNFPDVWLSDFNYITFENKVYCFIFNSANYTSFFIFELDFDLQGNLLDITLRETLDLVPIIDSYRADYPNNNTYLGEAGISNMFIMKNKLYIMCYSGIINVSGNDYAEMIPFTLIYDIDGGLIDYVNFSDLGTSPYHIVQNLDESDKFYLPNYPIVNGIKTIIKT